MGYLVPRCSQICDTRSLPRPPPAVCRNSWNAHFKMLFVCLFVPARLQGLWVTNALGLNYPAFFLYWLDVHARLTLTHMPTLFTNCAEALLFVVLVDLQQSLQRHQKAGREGSGPLRLAFFLLLRGYKLSGAGPTTLANMQVIQPATSLGLPLPQFMWNHLLITGL